MSYTYDPAAHTLTIKRRTGYEDVLNSSVPVNEVRIFRDTSDYSDIPTPDDFPLPGVEEAYFEATLIQPPRFSLPATCKLYVQLGNSSPFDEGQKVQAIAPIDSIYPWFEVPGVEVLQLHKFGAASTPPPPSSVKHLLLAECEGLQGPLPQSVETFVLEHSIYTDGEQLDIEDLIDSLPRTLQSFAMTAFRSEIQGEILEGLTDFEQLRTLCVPAFLMPEDLWGALPVSLENLAIDMFEGDVDVPGIVEQLIEATEERPALRRILVQGQELEDEQKEDLERACLENNVVVTFSDRLASFGWWAQTNAPHLYWEERPDVHAFEFRTEPF